MLNKLTIANNFFIPIIDEMLDEFDGVIVFSKLDLKTWLSPDMDESI